MDDLPRLMTRQEVAEYLGVSLTTVQNLYLSGRLAHIRVGKSVRISAAALVDYLEGRAPAPRRPESSDDVSTWPPTPSLLSGGDDD